MKKAGVLGIAIMGLVGICLFVLSNERRRAHCYASFVRNVRAEDE